METETITIYTTEGIKEMLYFLKITIILIF